MSFPGPTLSGFTVFVRGTMNIGTGYLPDSSPYLNWAYVRSLDLVNPALRASPGVQGAWSPYVQAVYNLGGHILVEIARDISYPISGASWGQGLVTLTTSGANGMMPADRVAVSGISPVAYDTAVSRPFVVNSVNQPQNQITYAVASNPGPATVLGGASVSQVYFTLLRTEFKLNAFSPGVVANASDQGTAAGLDNPEFMKGLTLGNLQQLKTPWGRDYLAIAQDYGPGLWGIS